MERVMSDTTSTLVPVTFATVEEYQLADAKGRAAIRKFAESARDEAIREFTTAPTPEARDHWMTTLTTAQAALDTYKSPAKVAATVDYQSLVRDRIATLQAAILHLQSGRFDGAPEGFRWDGVTDGRTVDGAAIPGLTKVRKSAKRDLRSLVESALTDDGQPVAVIRRAVIEASGDGYVPTDGAVAAAVDSLVKAEKAVWDKSVTPRTAARA
jgi:hypothetical protein